MLRPVAWATAVSKHKSFWERKNIVAPMFSLSIFWFYRNFLWWCWCCFSLASFFSFGLSHLSRLVAVLFQRQLGMLISTRVSPMSQARQCFSYWELFWYNLLQEQCQSICQESNSCQGFTHYNASASPHTNFCETFPTIHSSIPCSNCVSGPSSCFCSGRKQ